MSSKIVLCSNCFKHTGLKLMAERLGNKDGKKCPNCGSNDGYRLTKEQAKDLAESYIQQGTYHRAIFGGAPIFGVSDNPPYLDDAYKDDSDIAILSEKSGLYPYRLAPQMWRVGITTWLEDLQSTDKTVRTEAIEKLFECAAVIDLYPGEVYYRLLADLHGKAANDPLTYDSPDWKYQRNSRFGIEGTRVLYLTTGIESAIYECRATIEDELHLATLQIEAPLRVIDLTTTDDTSPYPGENLSLSLFHLFRSGSVGYDISREIARVARSKEYDGIVFWSFFNQITHLEDKNIALFGSPLEDNTISVVSIERLLLNEAHYSFSFGPVLLD